VRLRSRASISARSKAKRLQHLRRAGAVPFAIVLTIRDGLPKICPLPSRYSIVAYASDFVESKQRFDRAEP